MSRGKGLLETPNPPIHPPMLRNGDQVGWVVASTLDSALSQSWLLASL